MALPLPVIPQQPDAYHLAHMLLLPGRPVRGSVAASLR